NATTVSAQPLRVFVAAQGNDANLCTFAAPCRTFQKAHDTVAANGEIDVLDPAGYGAVTITKSISIQGHGFSGISVSNGAVAITISAGANDVIHLNGVLIDGAGWQGNHGILFNTAKSLTVENSVFRSFGGNGLAVYNTTPAVLTVSNSYFADNFASGILLSPFNSASVKASIDRTVMSGNVIAGLNVLGQASTGGVSATVTDSVAANTSNGG